jgi:hypothetical protein
MNLIHVGRAGRLIAGIMVLASGSICLGQSKPKGPIAVTRADPNRIIAVIDGKQLTANQAWGMLNMVAPQVRRERAARLPELVQRLYMQRAIADEAVKMHLDKQSPWREKLARAHMVIMQGAINYSSQPEKDTDPGVVAQWHSTRDRILWSAYFGMAHTKEEREALLQKEKDKYKIEVKDADFFNGPAV